MANPAPSPESPTQSTASIATANSRQNNKASSSTSAKSYTMLEVARHTKASDCWIVIEGQVYNVTRFLDEHPGGEDVLIDCSGTDATLQFEDVGHSDEARALLKGLRVGSLREPTKEEIEKDRLEKQAKGGEEVKTAGARKLEPWLKWAVPVILIGIAYLIRKYTT